MTRTREISRIAGPAAVLALLASLLYATLGAFAFHGPREEVSAARFAAAEADAARSALGRLPGAVELFRAGRYGRAAVAFEEILAALPAADHELEAARRLGLEGPQHYRRLLSSVETNLGLCYLRSRRYTAAVETMRRAVASDRRSATAHSNLGVALLRAKRYPEAIAALEAALRRGAPGARVHLQLGEARLRTGEPLQARQALLQALRARSGDPSPQARGDRLEAERLLAEAELATGRLGTARRRLEAVLAAAPGDPLARYLLLQVLRRQDDQPALARHRALFERHATALAAVQAALAASPSEVAGLHWVADTYAGLGLDHLAEVHYRQLLARDPGDAAARRGLLSVHARARDAG